MLLLSHVSHVWLHATPQTAAHQAPPCPGFSRQEHWSGLPFPSPMHESEKWKWSRSVVSNSSGSHGLQPTRLLCPWDSPGKSTGVGCQCLLPHNTVKLNFPKWNEVIQLCPTLCDPMDCSLHPWDFPGKSTGVGCHFLLQRIFLTQRLNPGLLHWRQTVYCLSHKGSPNDYLISFSPQSNDISVIISI